jgi:hypothetical protein
MKLGILGVIAGTMLIGVPSLVCSSAHAQPSQTQTTTKKGVAPASKEQKEQKDAAQGTTSRSFEMSTSPIPADVPKASRVDPGK